MSEKTRKTLILAVLGLMLVSTSFPVISASAHGPESSAYPALQFFPVPNQYFQDILLGTSTNTTQNTTFFAPFSYNASSFTVNGKFVNFRFYPGASGNPYVGLYDVYVNQSPIANVSRMVYSQFQILNAGGEQFYYNIVGSIFYAYSDSTLLIVHNDPQALVQVFTYDANVTVTALLSLGLQPNSKYSIFPSSPSSSPSNGTVAIMFNDTELSGYFVSAGSEFTEQQVVSGNYYVTKTIPAGSFLNTFNVPSGDSSLASALSIIAEGMRHNVISYYAALNLQNGQASMEGAYFNNAFRVDQFSISRGDVELSMTPMQSGLPNTLVLVVSSSVFNDSSSNLVVRVNGVTVENSSSLPNMVNPYGNSTEKNVTFLGTHTIVTVYSPSAISSLSISVKTSQPENLLLTVVAPFTAALLVVTVASIMLFRRKNEGRQ